MRAPKGRERRVCCRNRSRSHLSPPLHSRAPPLQAARTIFPGLQLNGTGGADGTDNDTTITAGPPEGPLVSPNFPALPIGSNASGPAEPSRAASGAGRRSAAALLWGAGAAAVLLQAL